MNYLTSLDLAFLTLKTGIAEIVITDGKQHLGPSRQKTVLKNNDDFLALHVLLPNKSKSVI
jgi:hypothetical protein